MLRDGTPQRSVRGKGKSLFGPSASAPSGELQGGPPDGGEHLIEFAAVPIAPISNAAEALLAALDFPPISKRIFGLRRRGRIACRF